jgi:glutaminase
MDQALLEKWIEEIKPSMKKGRVAQYIPALAEADPHALGLSIVFRDGEVLTVGDCDEKFTLQSISKVITLILAMMDVGVDTVFDRVGMEPTGDPFNSIMKLELLKPSKPLNPMINAGAIAVSSLVSGQNTEEKLSRIVEFIRRITKNQSISINQKVLESEWETGDRNRALAYFLRDMGIIRGEIDPTLQVYFGQCSIEVTCFDMAHIGLCLALDGVNAWGERIFPADVARIAKTFMVTCGMYNASGEFAIRVGIPAKSGVSGGILALVPQRLGIGVVGPALDNKGNSIGGVRILECCSNEENWSIF